MGVKFSYNSLLNLFSFLSFLFIILWSSAFITSKIIVDNASPFSALFFRFSIVAIGFLITSIGVYFATKKSI